MAVITVADTEADTEEVISIMTPKLRFNMEEKKDQVPSRQGGTAMFPLQDQHEGMVIFLQEPILADLPQNLLQSLAVSAERFHLMPFHSNLQPVPEGN